jgi:ABC-type sugar transport system substrate-binding protein
MDSDLALAHANEFAEYPVDLAIIYHIDERIGGKLRSTLAHKGIPIIAVDIPILTTVFFGISNQQAGLLVGEELGRWIQTHWAGQVDKVLVVTEKRVLSVVQQRLDYGLRGLASYVQYDPGVIFQLDGGNQRAQTTTNVISVLERWQEIHRIAVICLNDDSALGVLDAARALGRESDMAVVGQNANLAIEEFQNPTTRLIASADYFPSEYGARLIELALKMLRGERVARENFIEPALVTAKEFSQQR